MDIHAHVSTASADCDGPFYRDYVIVPNDDEIAEHERANGVNDFSELHFKDRVLSGIVSWSPEVYAETRFNLDGFTYHEPTDEGFRSVEVRWCDDACDTDAYRQRDVYAEQMNY